MDTIKTINELYDNLLRFENYRYSIKYNNEYLKFLKRGTCFIIWQDGEKFLIGPSRFIGYQNNTIEKHNSNQKKDGRITNPAISHILKSSPVINEAAEQIYVNHCRELGIETNSTGAFGVARKYWLVNFEFPIKANGQNDTLAEEVPNDEGLIEGATKTVVINAYERNPVARKRCLEYYGYNCAVCDFNFENVYGKLGENFIHVHHLIPLHEIQGEYEVNPIDDLRPVCPNCHSILHRRKPAFYIEELREIIKQNQFITF
jgi:5-methylcytosine-specific restriction enzyme A